MMNFGIIYKFKSYITNHKRKVPGSIPGCPTSDMGSEPIAHRPIPQIKLFDEIVLPPGSLYRSSLDTYSKIQMLLSSG